MDGTLTPDALAHIEDCAACGRYRERLAAIIDPSSVLPREISPPRDLWSGIAGRLDATEERKVWRIPNFLPLAAAAGIAAILVASLFALPPRQSTTETAMPVRTPETDPIFASSPLPIESVEIGFVQTLCWNKCSPRWIRRPRTFAWHSNAIPITRLCSSSSATPGGASFGFCNR